MKMKILARKFLSVFLSVVIMFSILVPSASARASLLLPDHSHSSSLHNHDTEFMIGHNENEKNHMFCTDLDCAVFDEHECDSCRTETSFETLKPKLEENSEEEVNENPEEEVHEDPSEVVHEDPSEVVYEDLGEEEVLSLEETDGSEWIEDSETGLEEEPSSEEELLRGETLPRMKTLVAESVANYVLGDVNGNGFIDPNDATLIMRHATGITELSAVQFLAADLNGDGIVDQEDAIIVMQHCVGLAEKIPLKNILIQPSDLILTVGDEQYLEAVIIPTNASNKEIIWSSENTEIVAVDEYGRITAISEGETIITALNPDSGKSDECNIRVEKIFEIPVEAEFVFEDFVYILINNEMEVQIVSYLGIERTVDIPAAIEGKPVTSLGSGAFKGCENLEVVVIPENVEVIQEDVLSNCENLTFVFVSDNIEEIGEGAFSNSAQVTLVGAEDSLAQIYSDDNNIEFKAYSTPENSILAEYLREIGSDGEFTKVIDDKHKLTITEKADGGFIFGFLRRNSNSTIYYEYMRITTGASGQVLGIWNKYDEDLRLKREQIKYYVEARGSYASPNLPTIFAGVYRFQYYDTINNAVISEGRLYLQYSAAAYIGELPNPGSLLPLILLLVKPPDPKDGLDVVLLINRIVGIVSDMKEADEDLAPGFDVSYNLFAKYKKNGIPRNIYVQSYKTRMRITFNSGYTITNIIPYDYEISGSPLVYADPQILTTLFLQGYTKGEELGQNCQHDFDSFTGICGKCGFRGRFTVSYDANGGYGAPAPQKKEFGKPLILSNTVPKTYNGNGVFLGWATSETGDPVYASGSQYEENEDIKLYAVWLCSTNHTYGPYAYSYLISEGEKGHYQECTICGIRTRITPHIFSMSSNGASGHSARCNLCGFRDNRAARHNYGPYDYTGTSAGHYQYCLDCGHRGDTVPHSLAYKITASTHTSECSECGYSSTPASHILTIVSNGSSGHHAKCNTCGFEDNRIGNHNYSPYTYEGSSAGHYRYCLDCGYRGDTVPHSLTYTTTASTHTSVCSACGYSSTPASHTFSAYTADGATGHYQTCTACNYRTGTSAHSLSLVQNGSTGHYSKCSTCSYSSGTTAHNYSPYTYEGSSAGHYRYCLNCGYRGDIVSHSLSYSTTSTTHTSVCSTCGYSGTPANHSYGSYTSGGSTGHYRTCTVCSYRTGTSAHSLSLVQNGSTGHYSKCSTCSYTSGTTAHNYSPYTYEGSSAGHYRYCLDCKFRGDIISHSLSYSTTSTTHTSVCSTCGYSSTPANHSYGSYTSSGSTGHYRTCTTCGYRTGTSAHSLSTVQNGSTGHYSKCSTCNYTSGTSSHSYGSYKSNGSTGHYRTCGTCGYSSSTTSHSYGSYTNYSSSQHYRSCGTCGYKLYSSHTFGNWYYITGTMQRRNCTASGCNEYQQRY